MNAAIVLERLKGLGVSVTPRPNGNLWLEPASVIPLDLLEAVRQHKPEIMAVFRDETLPSPAEVADSVGTASDEFGPWVLSEWRRVSIPQWRDILQESTAQGDSKREAYARWMLREALLDPDYEERSL